MTPVENFLVNNYFLVGVFETVVFAVCLTFMYKFISRQENREKIGFLRILGMGFIAVVVVPLAFWNGHLLKESEATNDMTWQQSFQYSENALLDHFQHHQDTKKEI